MKLTKPLSCNVRLILMVLIILYHGYAYSQENSTTVSGQITTEGKEPLPGVNIVVTGTTIGTITDIEGYYQIAVPGGYSKITVSYIGYMAQEIDIAGKTIVDVAMLPDISELSEIIVVGYGVQKKETLTGSISQIKGKDLVSSPQPNLSNSLTGRFSGLISNNRAGEPGYDDSRFYIRGKATTENNDVLIVIDGIPAQLGGLNRLNPNDIQSISVLKDGSAAVYGSRAANGVILVTTKKGNIGKPRINYSFNLGISSPTRVPEMADAATYAAIQNEIAYYRSPTLGMSQVYSQEDIQKFADGSDPLNFPNTDWAKATLSPYSLQHQHNLSVDGGNDKTRYYISLGKLFQDGLYKNGATKYDQYSFRSNITTQVTDNLDISLFLSGRQENRSFPVYGAGGIFRSIYRAYPTVIDEYPNGLPSWGIEGDNPIVMVTDIGGTDNNPKNIFNSILKANYKLPFVQGLSVDGFYAVDKIWDSQKRFSKPYILVYQYQSDENYTTRIKGGSNNTATLYERSRIDDLYTANIKLNFNRDFGEHSLSSFIGYEQSKNKWNQLSAERLNYLTPETPELSQGGSAEGEIKNDGSSFLFTRRSYIGRVTYNYKEKYMAEMQARIDGSSNFPRGNRYGVFPGFSFGWRLSQEEFMKSVDFISDLKIRASYGRLGNDFIPNFQYFNNYTFNSSYVLNGERYTGIELTKLGNAGITWETSEKTDIGLNIQFFNAITVEAIYFKQVRSDILRGRLRTIPTVVGIANPHNAEPQVPDENFGKVESSGFEATLMYKKTIGKLWLDVSGNITFAKNKIIDIAEVRLPDSLAHQMETGGPMDTRLIYKAIGIYKTEEDLTTYPHLTAETPRLGDLILFDYDGDGRITYEDMVRSKYSNIPQLVYGFNIILGWKLIDFSVLLAGQSRVSQYVLPESGTVGNFYSSWADNRWSPNNPEGSYPRVETRASTAVNGGKYPNDFWLNDASFLRVKNMALGITIPENFTQKAGIAMLRFNINAFNLFTFTKVIDYDPEGDSESAQFYPQQKIISFGVDVQF